ncbi:MAG: hypothetical protein OXG44_17320 [Gammaproteobacteria bacterium]|nr:hypothetical protein [Gammaproteobacteria bacterium]
MQVRPIELRDANAFVAAHHRHHRPVTGHRFSLSLWDGDDLVGVAICGRPVARRTDQLAVLEVLRVCVIEGHPNGCSRLLGACARAAGAMGYRAIQTFTLTTETGASLRGVGWEHVSDTAGEWGRDSRPRLDLGLPRRMKWRRVL